LGENSGAGKSAGEKHGGGEAAVISQFIFLLFCISGKAPIGIDTFDMNRQITSSLRKAYS